MRGVRRDVAVAGARDRIDVERQRAARCERTCCAIHSFDAFRAKVRSAVRDVRRIRAVERGHRDTANARDGSHAGTHAPVATAFHA
jgi:hypothetical protein